ncbi:MAG: hypothetical protein ABW252_16050 [Polyangiales bacterium]
MAKVATGPLLDISRGAGLDGEVRPHERVPLWHHFREGQLLEVSGASPGKLSTVARLVAHAQGEGEPCAWILARDEAGFYPPDFALMGIDLAALAVVRVPKEAGAHAQVRAAEVLMRSGAFGLVVIDFVGAVPRGALAWQARLSGLARMHAARIVLLTPSARDAPSLGPLIGLRIEPELRAQPGRTLLTQHVLKSKLGGAARISPDLRSAPPGADVEAREKPALQPDGEGGVAASQRRGAELGDAERRPLDCRLVFAAAREARRVRG